MAEGIDKYLKTLAGPVLDAVNSLKSLETLETVFFSVDQSASNIIKTFGVGRENILSIKQNMTEAYNEVAKMGGSFEDIETIQKNIATTLNRNVILNAESYKEFYAMTEVTGQQIATITEAFKNAGYSIYDSSTQMNKVVGIAQDLGLSVQDVSSKVVTNMDYLNRFTFQGGVEGLAKMAAQASSLRVNMSSTLEFANKVFNPEGAIETAAALQRLGVTQAQLLDPLRLMNLAQNDPTELQNQIVEMTKSFVKMGEAGNFEIMPGAKGRLMEISKAMGIGYNELTKMALGSAELEEKMKRIKFPDTEQFASKETQQMIANLAERGKDGEYRIKFTDETGKSVEKNITELSPDDIDRIKTPPKKMEELATDQLSVLKSIEASIKAMSAGTAFAFAGTQTAEQVLMAEKEMYSKISDTFTKAFDVKTIREGLDTGLQGMFKSILEGNTLEGFKEAGSSMADLLSDIYGKFKEEGSKNWDEFIKSENTLIQVFTTLGEQIKKLGTEGIESLNEKLKKIMEGGEILPQETPPGAEIPGGKKPTDTPGGETPGGKKPTDTPDSNTRQPASKPFTNDNLKDLEKQEEEKKKNTGKKPANTPGFDDSSFIEQNIKFFGTLNKQLEILKNLNVPNPAESTAQVIEIKPTNNLNFTVEVKGGEVAKNEEEKLKLNFLNILTDPKIYQALQLQLEKNSANTIAEVRKLIAEAKIKNV